MVKMLVSLAAVGLLGASECRAQFVDNFDGEVLAPHWVIWGEPSHLEHTVGGGLLTVTDLPYPSGKHSPTNNASIFAQFSPVAGDFHARARVGWEPGSLRALSFSVGTSTALLVNITYNEQPPFGPLIRVQGGSGPNLIFPAPPPGMHEFLAVRQGSTMSVFLDGEYLVGFPAADSAPVVGVSMGFWIAYPNSGMQPLYVDRVEIVPAPGTAGLFIVALAAGLGRRR